MERPGISNQIKLIKISNYSIIQTWINSRTEHAQIIVKLVLAICGEGGMKG